MRVLIRGAGDIATGIALRLCRARLQVVMTDLARPTPHRLLLAGDRLRNSRGGGHPCCVCQGLRRSGADHGAGRYPRAGRP